MQMHAISEKDNREEIEFILMHRVAKYFLFKIPKIFSLNKIFIKISEDSDS